MLIPNLSLFFSDLLQYFRKAWPKSQKLRFFFFDKIRHGHFFAKFIKLKAFENWVNANFSDKK